MSETNPQKERLEKRRAALREGYADLSASPESEVKAKGLNLLDSQIKEIDRQIAELEKPPPEEEDA